VMLRAHTAAATLGVQLCYFGPPALLPRATGAAAMCGRRCDAASAQPRRYLGPLALLPRVTAAAVIVGRRCDAASAHCSRYLGRPSLLLSASGAAALAGRRCCPAAATGKLDGIASGDGHIFYKPSAMAAPLLQVVGRLLPAVPGVASFAAAGDRRFYHGLVDGGAAGGCRVDRRWSTMPYSPAAEIPRRDSSPAAILARRSYEGHGGPVCEQRSSTAETEPEKNFAV
jgi:hypothetical protein